jgi:glycosyltransferase involved in cell wall biosynthesis
MSTIRPDVLIFGDLASVHIQRLAVALNEVGFRVVVAGFGTAHIRNIATHSFGHVSSVADHQFLMVVPKLTQLVRRLRPRLLNAHYLSSYGVAAALATRLVLQPRPVLVQTVWGTDLLVTARSSAMHRMAARLALRCADLITGDSRDLEMETRRLSPGVAYHQLLFGPPRSLLRAPRAPSKTFVSSRRLDPDTRVPLIIAGFRRARELHPSEMDAWRLVVAGDGARRDEVEAASRGAGDISVVGWLSQSDLQATLLSAHAFLSVPVSDATSASLLEAMAAGAMPIVNDLPANREWVDDRIGFVLPRNPDANAMADVILGAVRRLPNEAAIRGRVEGTAWEDQVASLAKQFQRLAREA